MRGIVSQPQRRSMHMMLPSLSLNQAALPIPSILATSPSQDTPGVVPMAQNVLVTVSEYAWINDSTIGEAGCVTVVPDAERHEVLAAFGAVESSGRPADSFESLDMGTGEAGGHICVIELGDALIVIENNGFQGSRFEVLQPASTASGVHLASSCFWNVNAETSFSAARRGKSLFSVELIGAEDDEMDGVPKKLRTLVIEAGVCGRGHVGRWPRTRGSIHQGPLQPDSHLPRNDLRDQPRPAALQTHLPDYTYIYGMDDVALALTTLTPRQQRRVAEWATRAAAVEADIADEPTVRRVLGQLGDGDPPILPASIDPLARAAAKKHDHFTSLEDDLEEGGLGETPSHPYYGALAPGPFGEKVLSHLEGAYLAQRRTALEAVRYVAHPDSFSAAAGCLIAASLVFENGRTSRGWIFTQTDKSRHHVGMEPNPRHDQFVQAATTLVAELALSGSEEAVTRATAALPTPLTAEHRTTAIQADARAAADGAFAEYQITRAAPADENEDEDDVTIVDWTSVKDH